MHSPRLQAPPPCFASRARWVSERLWCAGVSPPISRHPGFERALALLLQVVAQAAAVAAMEIPACMNDITDTQRAALAKELGYRKIGKELPDGVSLSDVVKSLPKEVGGGGHGEASHPAGGLVRGGGQGEGATRPTPSHLPLRSRSCINTIIGPRQAVIPPPGWRNWAGLDHAFSATSAIRPTRRAAPTLTPALPLRQVFELDHGKAWRAVLTSIVSMSACLYLISISPWYLLPFAWALAGTAFTGVSSSVR
jgi:hypothetical protein